MAGLIPSCPRRSEHTSAHRAIKLLMGSFSTLCNRLWSTLSQPAAGPEAWCPPPAPPAQSVTAPTLLLIPRMCDSEWNNLKSSYRRALPIPLPPGARGNLPSSCLLKEKAITQSYVYILLQRGCFSD